MQRKTHKRKPKVEATTAFEAMEKMVQERKLSKKINYDVLKDLDPSAFKADATEFPPVRCVGLTFTSADLQGFFLPPPLVVGVLFSPLFVCLSVFYQDNSQSYVWIFVKFGEWVGYRPEKN